MSSRTIEPRQPDPEDRFPAWCECGFKADTIAEMEQHEHANVKFSKKNVVQKDCAVCCPPDDLRERMETDRKIPFCDRHDEEDFQEKLNQR